MNLLVDGTGAVLGAAGLTRVRELARALPALRPEHRFQFVLRPEVAEAVREVAPGTAIWTLPRAFGAAPMRIAWQHTVLPQKARVFRPDVVFALFNIAPAVRGQPRPALAVMVSNVAPYSDVVRAHSSRREALRNRFLGWLTNRSLKRADLVFFQSPHALDLVPVPGLREKSVVLPAPAPPPTRARPGDSPESHGEPYLIVVGDLFGFKGVETVVEAIARLEPTPLLLVCGRHREPKYVERLRAKAARAGVSSRVRLLGSIPQTEVLALMRNAVACVASSRFENHSRIPGEAMSLGTPVVACDTPSYREAARGAALYYAPDDAAHLAQQLERLMSERSLRERLEQRGRAHLESVRGENQPAVIAAALDRLGGAPVKPERERRSRSRVHAGESSGG